MLIYNLLIYLYSVKSERKAVLVKLKLTTMLTS